MDSYRYLDRMNYSGSVEPDIDTLRALQEMHLYTVPFENLDIHMGRKILLDAASLWTKIVEQRRGGLCYELSGSFALLLRSLGFQVDLLSAGLARIFSGGGFGPEFDHLTLLIHLKGNKDWLVDVGLGDSFRQPLLLQTSLIQSQRFGTYRLEKEGDYWILQQQYEDWIPLYRFTLHPHELMEFSAMCEFYQTAPTSPFVHQRLCSIATPSGRITLSDQRLIKTIQQERQEYLLTTQEEYDNALLEYFQIVV